MNTCIVNKSIDLVDLTAKFREFHKHEEELKEGKAKILTKLKESEKGDFFCGQSKKILARGDADEIQNFVEFLNFCFSRPNHARMFKAKMERNHTTIYIQLVDHGLMDI